jgi:hypothetical protein
VNAAHGLDDAAAGLEELAGLINFRVGQWQDFGYEEPPTPESATIPPLGQRSAKAIEAGHEAIKDIDQLIARLHQIRALLVSELREDEDIRTARIGELLGETSEPVTAEDDAGRAIVADLGGLDDPPCPETSDSLHCGHWLEGGKCCACGQTGPEPDEDGES